MSREDLGKKVRRAVDQQLDAAERTLKADPRFSAWQHVPEEFTHEDIVRYRSRSFLQVFREPLRRRGRQTLALIDLVRRFSDLDESNIVVWVEK
jgi:hypothetical protein